MFLRLLHSIATLYSRSAMHPLDTLIASWPQSLAIQAGGSKQLFGMKPLGVTRMNVIRVACYSLVQNRNLSHCRFTGMARCLLLSAIWQRIHIH